ncbi:hypothetical protein FV220_16740 [Methylobacterium sp. WL19]|nr:hypothetical protein FV220_16740 [Methylobacterium sp. WL19]
MEPLPVEREIRAPSPLPAGRGEGRGDLVVPAASEGVSRSEGEGVPPEEARPKPPPHPRLPPRFGPGEGAETLSPQAGRGGVPHAPHRIGGPYCRPPWFQRAFRPRGIFSGVCAPTLRSNASP